jgi:Bacteriophage probable baseplate hub protein
MPDADALQSSRPTIQIAGSESSSLTGGLLRMRAREDLHGLSNCELEFGNWGPNGDSADFLFFDRKLLDFGKELKISVADKPLFTGKITGIEARYPQGNSPSIVVLAEDRFQDLRMTRRTRTFADVNDKAVFSQMAGDHGLSPDVTVTGPTHKVLAQLNQSDLAFMRERARSLDAELWMTDSTLSVKPRADRGSSPVTLTYGKELREFRVLADLAGQATSLEVTGWDVSEKTTLKEQATDSVVTGELAGGDSGPSVLSVAFGTRKDSVANAVPQTSDEARARAEALLKRRARRFIVGHGTAETRAELRVGATVKLGGLGPLFEGGFYVASVSHLFDGAHGLRTELEVERPGLGKPR